VWYPKEIMRILIVVGLITESSAVILNLSSAGVLACRSSYLNAPARRNSLSIDFFWNLNKIIYKLF
jgi:hypothetical protein